MIYLIFSVCLLVTMVTEGFLIWLLYRRQDYLYYSFLVNLLTNPALNLILYTAVFYWGATVYYPLLSVLEIVVVITEALIYRLLSDLKIKTTLLLSLFLNGLSFLVGLLINYLW